MALPLTRAAEGEIQRGEQVSQIPRRSRDGETHLSCPTQSFEGAPKEGVLFTKLSRYAGTSEASTQERSG